MKGLKTGKRRIQAIATKERIYRSAELLFGERGVNDVSIDDIVKLAKVAKGSFYVYFKSKNELITLLINDHTKGVDSEYKEFLDSVPPDMSICEVLTAFVGKIADELTQTIGRDNMARIYQIGLEQSNPVNAVVNYNRALYLLFKELIDRGVNQGVFCVESADIIAQHFVAAYRGLAYEWCVRYPDFDLKKQALYHFDILLNGIIKHN